MSPAAEKLLQELARAGSAPNGGLTGAEAGQNTGAGTSVFKTLKLLQESGLAVQTEHKRASSTSSKRRRLAPVWEITEEGMERLLRSDLDTPSEGFQPPVLDDDDVSSPEDLDALDFEDDTLEVVETELFSQGSLPDKHERIMGNITLRASAAIAALTQDDSVVAADHLRAILAESKL